VDAADLTIWLVFLGDYLVRLSLAPSRWRFVRTHLPDLALVALRPCARCGSCACSASAT